jgi:predicted HTH transcriptional regulator
MAHLHWFLRFFLIGYVEQFGTGTQRMIDLLQQAGLPEPEFESREHFFRVLFRKPVPIEKRFAHSDLNGRQVIALARIFHRGIEQRSGERVRRLEITQPNENATHRFFDHRL